MDTEKFIEESNRLIGMGCTAKAYKGRIRMSLTKWFTLSRITGLLYLFMVTLSFCLLFCSRSGEVHTVWEVLHPMFIPVFFVTTFLLLTTIFSSNKSGYKLLLIIIHSILCVTFFAIIFPSGNVGVQQKVLGGTRRVFDNMNLHGIFGLVGSVPLQIYLWCRGDHLLAALSVILARMFAVDVYWIHLLLIPILWGTFVPIGAYLITKTMGQNENVSVLSSLLMSSLPTAIMWGTQTFANSLGYIFFFFSVFFMCRYLSSNKSKHFFLMLACSVVSMLSHSLTAVASIALLILTASLRNYVRERDIDATSAKITLLTAFMLSASLIPVIPAYLHLLYPIPVHFGFDKLYEVPLPEIITLFIFGEFANLSYASALIRGFGSLLGAFGMIYILTKTRRTHSNKSLSPYLLLLLLGFCLFLIDYRILKLFVVNVPFDEERIWMLRDFLAIPFAATLIGVAVSFVRKKLSSLHIPLMRPNISSLVTYAIMFISISGLITASVYKAYPSYGPLQTTSYELEAVKYIETTTNQTYIVICDQWIIYVGAMFVGIQNPRAFYFSDGDPRGVALFIEMRKNPSHELMEEAMKYNNATVAYFIVEKPRLGTDSFNQVVSQASANGLSVYQIFSYEGEEKLYIFYHEKQVSE